MPDVKEFLQRESIRRQVFQEKAQPAPLPRIPDAFISGGIPEDIPETIITTIEQPTEDKQFVTDEEIEKPAEESGEEE